MATTGRPPYLPRVLDAELIERLAFTGAVLIEGPKACGKTATARQHAASEVLLDLDADARQAIAVDSRLVLGGAVPRLIDEWQVEPSVWNAVRREVDDRGRPGQFILTGSAVPADDATRHTGAGRIGRLRMRPMSLFESRGGVGGVSVAALFDGAPTSCPDPGLAFDDVVSEIVMGGWPAVRELPLERARRAVRDYLDEVRRVDISSVDGVRRDPVRVMAFLRSLARNVATQAGLATMAADAGGADGPLKPDTARAYLAALQRLMIVEDQPAWRPHLRSKHQLRTTPTRHFVDPSLAVAALGASPDQLRGDLNLLGLLFESLAVRDLRVYAQALGGEVQHYRDHKNLEVDAVVQIADGRWAAFEIKLGQGQVDAAADSLLTFARRVDTTKMGAPVALGVVVGAGYGYLRPDGVHVIPVGGLAP